MGKEFDNTNRTEIPRNQYVPPSNPNLTRRAVFIDYPSGEKTVLIYHNRKMSPESVISAVEDVMSQSSV